MCSNDDDWILVVVVVAFVTVLLGAVGTVLVDTTSPAMTKAKMVVVTPKSPRLVTVDYRIRFEWVYTGTPNSYNDYSGRKVFEAKEPEGMPINHVPPESTVISFTKVDGRECKFYIGRQDGIVICSASDIRLRDIYPLATKVTQTSPDHYEVLAALSRYDWRSNDFDTTVLDQM